MEIQTNYTAKPVFDRVVANELCKRGYIITALKPNRRDKQQTVYWFMNQDGLMSDICELKKTCEIKIG